jgi:hypothetical protein
MIVGPLAQQRDVADVTLARLRKRTPSQAWQSLQDLSPLCDERHRPILLNPRRQPPLQPRLEHPHRAATAVFLSRFITAKGVVLRVC